MQKLLLLLPFELHSALGQRQRHAAEGQGGAAADGPLQSSGRVCAAQASEILVLVLSTVPPGLSACRSAHTV